MSIKKLSFKGDAPKKRKRAAGESNDTKKSSLTQRNNAEDEDEEGWLDASSLEDLKGPIIITFKYDVPVSLIADARGSLFTTPLDPPPTSLSEAVPHDVRQVFIASGIVGRAAGTVSLKNGATSKYMTSDRFGDVKCDRDAIGPTEEWTLVKRPDGWAVQSIYEKYLSIDKTNTVRSDVEDIGFCETFRIRIQARTRSKRLREARTAAGTVGAMGLSLLGKKDLEVKCGRSLSMDEVEVLHEAQRDGSLGEAVLDMRVKGRSDKFG